jgi:hypothetical protein
VHRSDPIPASPTVRDQSTTSDEHSSSLIIYPGITPLLLHDQVLGIPFGIHPVITAVPRGPEPGEESPPWKVSKRIFTRMQVHYSWIFSSRLS